MTILKTGIDTREFSFADNADAMRSLVADLRDKVHEIKQGGGARSRDRHLSRGKLLPRDRVRTLLDPGTPYLELSQLAAYGVYEEQIPAAGILTGIGRVAGRECVIVANDATVKGGTYYPLTVNNCGHWGLTPYSSRLTGAFRPRTRPRSARPGRTCSSPAAPSSGRTIPQRPTPTSWQRSRRL